MNWSDETVLALAVEKSSDINSLVEINGVQVSQLMVACFHGNSDYVKDLLEVPGIKTDLQNDEGIHALMCACLLGHTEIAQQIVNTSQSLPTNDGMTSLLIASQNGHSETVSMLLQHGAHINMQNHNGFSSLMLASQNGHTETVEMLLQNGGHVNIQDNNGLQGRRKLELIGRAKPS